jgi:HSP20 family protein
MTRKTQNQSRLTEAPDPTPNRVVWERIIVQHSSVWRPPTDVYEVDGNLVVLIEIAGMRDGDLNIVLHDRYLMVRGVRRQMVKLENVAYHQMEIPRGEFRTQVYFPWDVQRDQVTATYRDGLLRIELPQAKTESIHIINVSAEEEA